MSGSKSVKKGQKKPKIVTNWTYSNWFQEKKENTYSTIHA